MARKNGLAAPLCANTKARGDGGEGDVGLQLKLVSRVESAEGIWISGAISIQTCSAPFQIAGCAR